MSECVCTFISEKENVDVFLSVNMKVLIKHIIKIQTDISAPGVFLPVSPCRPNAVNLLHSIRTSDRDPFISRKRFLIS
jgi:hypothetical protein